MFGILQMATLPILFLHTDLTLSVICKYEPLSFNGRTTEVSSIFLSVVRLLFVLGWNYRYGISDNGMVRTGFIIPFCPFGRNGIDNPISCARRDQKMHGIFDGERG